VSAPSSHAGAPAAGRSGVTGIISIAAWVLGLLLVLAVEPEAFFRVAVLRGTRRRATRRGA